MFHNERLICLTNEASSDDKETFSDWMFHNERLICLSL